MSAANGDVTPRLYAGRAELDWHDRWWAGVEAESPLAITIDATIHTFPTVGERLVEAGV